jgi:hypothetical protein
MTAQIEPDRLQYRLIITRRRATQVLLSAQPAGRSLPRLNVHDRARLAPQLIAGVKENYHLEAYCLSMNSFSPSVEQRSCERYAVMEALDHTSEAPPGTSWVSSATVASNGTLLPADQEGVGRALADLDRYIAQPERGPFARPGWIEELFAWVRNQLEPLALHVTGRFQQLNASPTFSLMRIETTGDAVWFKATGEPNAHELPVSLTLARLFPENVPTILGVHPSWNGWLLPELPGTSLDEVTECSAWERVTEGLAQLQIASMERKSELMQCGLNDLRLSKLAELIDPFLARMSDLMAAQEKQHPLPLTDRELFLLGNRLRGACSLLHSFGVPDALGNVDFNPANIMFSIERSIFLDWAEAYWGHPVFTLEYLLQHFRRRHLPLSWESQLKSSYARSWLSVCSAEALSETLSVAPLVAVFAYVVAGVSWRDPERFRDQRVAGYLRSMTRRIEREASLLRERLEQCPR